MELAGGPVDIVLIGFEILANYMDTLFKAQDLKKLELQTIAVRSNYVSGYKAGMRGRRGGIGRGPQATSRARPCCSASPTGRSSSTRACRPS